MFPFKFEAIADKRTNNPLRSEEKKKHTYFKSDWTCFKENNSVSPMGHTFPLKIGQESRTTIQLPQSSRLCAADARDRCFPVCNVV